MKKVLYLIIVAVSIFMISCENDVELTKNDINQDYNIMTFNSYEEYNEEVNKKALMTSEELCKYEEDNNYYSLARKSEEVYFSVNSEDFKTEEEIVNFVKKNSKYLEILTDENNEKSVEIRSELNPGILVANDDGMYIITNNVYKLVGNFTILADKKYQEKIKDVNMSNYTQYLNDSTILFPEYIRTGSTKGNLVLDYDSVHSPVQLKRRNIIESTLSVETYQNTNGSWDSQVKSYIIGRPQKKTIFWFNCYRTMYSRLHAYATYYYNGQWNSLNLYKYFSAYYSFKVTTSYAPYIRYGALTSSFPVSEGHYTMHNSFLETSSDVPGMANIRAEY